MARIRTIKPQITQDARLASASRDARLTFLYLFTQADDEGYFRASGRLLLGQLYPHDPEVTEAMLVGWLDELRHRGLLTAFDSDEGILGRIVNFMKHQKIDHKTTSYLASLSRKPRERFAPVVLSLESLVLSPEQDKAGADAPVELPGYLQPLDLPPLPEKATAETVGAFYGRALKPVLWPKAHPDPAQQRDRENRDVSVLRRQLATVSRGDIEDAVTEMRRQAEDGQLDGWIHPGDGFGLKALFTDPKGGISTFERFRHAAVKRRECEAA